MPPEVKPQRTFGCGAVVSLGRDCVRRRGKVMETTDERPPTRPSRPWRSLLERCEYERDEAMGRARALARENRALRQWKESTQRYLNQILDDPGVQAALDALTRSRIGPAPTTALARSPTAPAQ